MIASFGGSIALLPSGAATRGAWQSGGVAVLCRDDRGRLTSRPVVSPILSRRPESGTDSGKRPSLPRNPPSRAVEARDPGRERTTGGGRLRNRSPDKEATNFVPLPQKPEALRWHPSPPDSRRCRAVGRRVRSPARRRCPHAPERSSRTPSGRRRTCFGKSDPNESSSISSIPPVAAPRRRRPRGAQGEVRPRLLSSQLHRPLPLPPAPGTSPS